MTFKSVIDGAVKSLAHNPAGKHTPYLDTIVLLAYAAGTTKERILASLPDEIPSDTVDRFYGYLRQRLKGIPVSYIRGVKEFWGLDFLVDERVLVPRPDTEILVETALDIIDTGEIRSIHDCCTGTGCIAIIMKRERPAVEVSASDKSAAALEVFRENCRRIGVSGINGIVSDLMNGVPGRFDMITANPPYLSSGEVDEMLETGWPEPASALVGGMRGVELPKRLVSESLDSLEQDGYLVMEAASCQMDELSDTMKTAGFGDIRIIADLSGNKRIIYGRRGAVL
jgi:release factor glutamine methyltransferase